MQNTLVGFLEEQEMEAKFALVVLVLSLCHQRSWVWTFQVDHHGLLVQVVKQLGRIGMPFSTKMEPMTLEDQIVLGTINYLKASAAEKDMYQSENATEALKDSFLFLAMKFSSRWQTKKSSPGPRNSLWSS